MCICVCICGLCIHVCECECVCLYGVCVCVCVHVKSSSLGEDGGRLGKDWVGAELSCLNSQACGVWIFRVGWRSGERAWVQTLAAPRGADEQPGSVAGERWMKAP